MVSLSVCRWNDEVLMTSSRSSFHRSPIPTNFFEDSSWIQSKTMPGSSFSTCFLATFGLIDNSIFRWQTGASGRESNNQHKSMFDKRVKQHLKNEKGPIEKIKTSSRAFQPSTSKIAYLKCSLLTTVIFAIAQPRAPMSKPFIIEWACLSVFSVT
jgi:hypothetical protein